jgi:predicted Rossmann fold nucleotide-binding protein DprA/Smf involved in DNA uptake
VSAAEGQLFANTVAELTDETKKLGPMDRAKHRLQLAALETVLKGPRMRWLTGMDRHLIERGNVYGEKLDAESLHAMAKQAAVAEYEKALILESLAEGPRSVREMAATTGLPVYTVSIRLNDLERRGQAELKGYEGSTPRFIRLAA